MGDNRVDTLPNDDDSESERESGSGVWTSLLKCCSAALYQLWDEDLCHRKIDR